MQPEEFGAVVPSARQLVEETYRDFIFRTPTADEITGHLGSLRRNLASNEQAPRDGSGLQWLDIRPFNVEMDITNQCNIRCVMCYFAKPEIGKRTRRDLDLEDFERLAVELFPLVRRLSLTLGTESLIHRDFVRFAAIAKDFGIPKVYVNTNAVLLDEDVSRELIRIGFDAINVSLDAGSARTFQRVRRGARWDRVIGNLRRLHELKVDLGVDHPELTMSFVMMRSTIDEVPQFLRLAKELGAHGAHLLHLVPYDGLDLKSETLDREPARCNRILDEACALSAELGLLLRTPKRFELPRESVPHIPANVDQDRKRHDLGCSPQDEARQCCPFPWHFVGIRGDGEVQPCGWWFQGPSMGNVYRKGFRAVWEGDNWTSLREILSNGQFAEDCLSCPAAGPGDVQRSESFGTKAPL